MPSTFQNSICASGTKQQIQYMLQIIQKTLASEELLQSMEIQSQYKRNKGWATIYFETEWTPAFAWMEELRKSFFGVQFELSFLLTDNVVGGTYRFDSKGDGIVEEYFMEEEEEIEEEIEE